MSNQATVFISIAALRASVAETHNHMAANYINSLPRQLQRRAEHGDDFHIVTVLDSLPAYGRLSFDGTSESLNPSDRLVWNWLVDKGLKPYIISFAEMMVADDTVFGHLGNDRVPGATKYGVIAQWGGVPQHDDTALVKELRATTGDARDHQAKAVIAGLPDLLNRAARCGNEWCPVYAFQGIWPANPLLPFNGQPENLSGIERQVWDYLVYNRLNPRLYHVQRQTVKLGDNTLDTGNHGRTYHIAAQWYEGHSIESALLAFVAKALVTGDRIEIAVEKNENFVAALAELRTEDQGHGLTREPGAVESTLYVQTFTGLAELDPEESDFRNLRAYCLMDWETNCGIVRWADGNKNSVRISVDSDGVPRAAFAEYFGPEDQRRIRDSPRGVVSIGSATGQELF